ncbi:hypothetical protein CANARDRAFT_28945 [[Candida] arabinofermentans NRRL YB-2248]|uniref:Sec39 domain-containing protein n=1 Tax=[Candida] arabinofermentans NRRL YB-2248 TaxID=983967 RepID=A0A1E4SZ72_9ASCO|nr:hypothetical protein CANARDRAFT_28945 [[Candida] arabinofermentans NRRL YB-2248]
MQSQQYELYASLQYIASSLSSISELDKALSTLLPVIHASSSSLPSDSISCSISEVLKSLVVNIPELLSASETFECVHQLLVSLENFHNNATEDDSIIEARDLFDGELPTELEYLLGLSESSIRSSVFQLHESIQEQASKSHWLDYTDEEQKWSPSFYETLFSTFVKARILKVNSTFSDYSLIASAVDDLPTYEFFSWDLEKWLIGFLQPLSNLSSYPSIPNLIEWEDLLSQSEQTDMIINLAIETGNYDLLINKTLAPYLSYIEDGWTYFNQWLIQHGRKVLLKSTSSIETVFEIIVQILRQDRLFTSLDGRDRIQSDLASILLSIIYLCPKTSLSTFVFMKEILVTLESLNLPPTSENHFDIDLDKDSSIEDMYKKINISRSLVRTFENHVETAERLYANELSLMEIINLSNSNETKQLHELERFIANEAKYGKNAKQWNLLLGSIYWIFKNTTTFNRISVEQLDVIIFEKLVELKFFDILSNTFRIKYCTFSDDVWDRLVIKHAWIFYNKATNCDKYIGYLKNSLDCLTLITDSNNKDALQLNNLINAVNDLLEWKLYFEVGIPITPKYILEMNDPFKIVSKILELNGESYHQSSKLFNLLKMLILGLACYESDSVYKHYDEPETTTNPLLVKLKLIELDFSAVVDFEFSYNLSIELIDLAVEYKFTNPELFEMVQENRYSFFQLVKNEYDEYEKLELLKLKLNLLSKLMLVAPTDFNLIVLEQWQVLNSEKDELESQLQGQDEYSQQSDQKDDLQSRFQRSLQSSATEILRNAEGAEIGKNIIGWIVGAQ